MKLLLFLCFLTHFVFGIYEDQLGKFDWHRRQIGIPQHVAFSSKKPRLFISSRTGGVVANINLRDGEIKWRQKLDESVEDCFLYERENLSLTSTRNRIFAWDVAEGTQKWEVSFEDEIRTQLFLEGKLNGWVVLSGTILEMRHPTTGGVKWTLDTRTKVNVKSNVFLVQESDFVYLIALSTKIEVLKIYLKSGELEMRFKVPLGDRVHAFEESTSVQLTNDQMIFFSSNGLCIVPLQDPTYEQIQCLEQTEDQIYPLRNTFLRLNNYTDRVVLSKWTGTGVHDLVSIEDFIAHSGAPKASSMEAIAVLQRHPVSSEHSMVVLDASTGAQLLHENYSMIIPVSFQLQSFHLGNYQRKDGSTGFRYVLISHHGEILMLQQGQLVWRRNEAPSAVKQALFIDPPTHSSEDDLPTLTKWLKAQFLTLKIQFQLHSPKDRDLLYELKQDLSGKKLISKDISGCRKFIVVLTELNSVLALHNGNGRILWQRDFSPDKNFNGLTQFTHALQQNRSPKILLYKTGLQQSYMVIDGHYGEVVEEGTFQGMVSKVVKLPQTVKIGDLEQSLFLLMDLSSPTPSARLFPLLESYPVQDLKKFVFWTSDNQQGIVRGFGVNHIDITINSSVLVTFHPIWSLTFHTPIQLAIERTFNDPVHSYTKVLGDRSLLFKYLNPNTALIVTGGVDPTTEFEDSDLEAFLVDTITGRVLYRQMHDSAKGPVHGVISQHWAAYHYWSTVNQRFQISTLEFYDASHKQLTLSDLFLKGIMDSPEVVSSYKPVPVKVFNATYFTSVPVKTLEVTRTLRGITTQLLLMGTTTDQIYSTSKRFLDPRRPIKPDLETKEERLIPFAETLPVNPTQYVSYNHIIMGLKEVITAPTGLESTSHVFSFGLDLYYVRLQPERGFDTLDEDFNFGFLILTLLAMIIVSLICRKLVQDAKLSKKWK